MKNYILWLFEKNFLNSTLSPFLSQAEQINDLCCCFLKQNSYDWKEQYLVLEREHDIDS